MKLIESIHAHRARGTALLATNFYNLETLLAVLRAARQVGCPIILQTSPSTLDYLGGPLLAVAMAKTAAAQEGVTAWLHLDHATELDLLKSCVDAGYDSVMIDGSESDLRTNIRLAQQAVRYAYAAGVAVEAELGYIPKLGQRDADFDGFTQPDQARHFVQETGVDLLAVAIGTQHGFYKEPPRLDFDRLVAIREAISTPLVLHGGSGLSSDAWQTAIQHGIVKINFATEIKDTFIRHIKSDLQNSDQIDLRNIFPPAIRAVTDLVSTKLRICQRLNPPIGHIEPS
jgi:fructose-bisphosphate aldolase class II/tagatose 1,6-diphosphate aldolase GatY/KbaY